MDGYCDGRRFWDVCKLKARHDDGAVMAVPSRRGRVDDNLMVSVVVVGANYV